MAEPINYIETGQMDMVKLNTLLTGIGPTGATLVVAASDSLHKERADYVCDGVDDQVEIQVAIDTLPAGGGKIVLMEGIYDISEALSAKSNLVIEGNGMGVTNIICSNKNTVFFSTPGAAIENIVLRGFSINGQGDVGVQGGGSSIAFYNIVNFLIEDIYIEKGGWHNFYISQGSKNGVINRCLSTQSWDDNFAIGGSDTSVERISITNCISWDTFTSWSDHVDGQSHYEVDDGAHDISIIGCYAYDTIDHKKPAVHIHSHAGCARGARISVIGLISQNTSGIVINSVDYPLITNCQIYNANTGIIVRNTTENALIKGNTICGSVSYGVYIYGNNNFVTIDGNMLQQSDTGSGIYVKDAQTQTSVKNNTIVGGYRGIKINSDNVYIGNNVIYNQVGVIYPGIFSSGAGLNFVGNRIGNNQGVANVIHISGNDISIKGNHITVTGSIPLGCAGNNLTIADNKIEGVHNCIDIYAESHTIFIRDNFIVGTGISYGIYIHHTNTTGQYIDNNYINSYKGIKIEGSGGRIAHNVINTTTLPINILGNIDSVYENIGYVTKNSNTSTGTGAQQTIAHGLAKTPTKVILWNIEDGANPYQNAPADATNIYITAVVNQDYGWKAEAE